MSSVPYSKPYVESSIYIAFIRGEKDQGPKRNQDAKAIFGKILDAAKSGSFPIYTSAVTIAEVHKKKEWSELTEQQSVDLCPYFREEFVKLVEIERGIGERANELCRTHVASAESPALRPIDAIHIASAEKCGCEVLLTWDPKLLKQKIEGLRIEIPTDFDAQPFKLESPK